MNPIELEWQPMKKKDELTRDILDSKLEVVTP